MLLAIPGAKRDAAGLGPEVLIGIAQAGNYSRRSHFGANACPVPGDGVLDA